MILELIQKADKVIFPGVGEASTAMQYLKERKLDTVIKNLQQPVLGICLGMQLMCNYSEENDTHCLGIFDEPVKHFVAPAANDDIADYKVPQMGWNNIYDLKTPLFDGLIAKQLLLFCTWLLCSPGAAYHCHYQLYTTVQCRSAQG